MTVNKLRRVTAVGILIFLLFASVTAFVYPCGTLRLVSSSVDRTNESGGYAGPWPRPRRKTGGRIFAIEENEESNHDAQLKPKSTLQRVKSKFQSNFPVLSSKVERLHAYLLPSISFQDTTKMPFPDHFRPRFIAKEAILGARIMSRLYCALASVGLLFELLIVIFPILPAVPVAALSGQGGIHTLEAWTKDFLYSRLLQPPISIQLTVSGPILEEIFYRGIGFLAAYWDAWSLHFLLSTVGGFSAPLSIVWALQMVALRFQRLSRFIGNASTFSILELLRFCWIALIPAVLHLHLHFRILKGAKVAREDHTILSSDSSGSTTKSDGNLARSELDAACNSVPEAHRRRCQLIANRAIRLGKANSETSSALACMIQRYLLYITRWKTSTSFASAHLPSRHVSPKRVPVTGHYTHYAYLRKFLGVFCSSMLVESRLVARRGTIWGAMAAHVCFNTLTIVRLLLEGIFEALMSLGLSGIVVPERLSVAVVRTLPPLLSVVALQWLLHGTDGELKRLETGLVTDNAE